MRYLLFSILVLLSASVFSQSIKTTVKEPFETKRVYTTIHSFAYGDTVVVHAYKKKSDRYYFVVETDDYADRISCNNIPFDAVEKQLKKLPNALGNDMSVLITELQQNVEGRKKAEYKKKALEGKVDVTIQSYYSFYPQENAVGEIKRGDKVYLIGYKSTYLDKLFAFYNESAAGIFRCSSTSGLFSREVNLNYLPSTDDQEVRQLIAEKQRAIMQIKAEEKLQYRKKALAGEITGVLSYTTLTSVDGSDKPFDSGDTVAVLGYSKVGTTHYYALYSNDAVGTVKSSYSPSSSFRNSDHIEFDKLPAFDDPEVVLKLKEQKAIVDSELAARLADSQRRLAETQEQLIQLFKDNDPVIVKLDSWDSNSVGGIEVSLSVTNCSSQTIKYITIQGYFTNAVGDKCRNEIGGGTVWRGRGVGPIGPRPTTLDDFYERIDGCKASYSFDNLTFYSRIAEYFHFSSVTIQYMNGKTITLSGNNLKKHVRY